MEVYLSRYWDSCSRKDFSGLYAKLSYCIADKCSLQSTKAHEKHQEIIGTFDYLV